MNSINYKIIDNLPQKNMVNNMDTIKINEMIIGYETVQDISDLDSTNKYNLEVNQEQVPVVIKNNNVNNIKNDYIVVLDNGDADEQIQQEKKDYMIKSASNNNKKNDDNKMNTFTTFYVGSLTIVGLFIFYRLIQKTK
jgi:hypothetical protein